MKLLPLFDADAPIACTISDKEKSGRADAVMLMRRSLSSFERTEHGMILNFPAGEQIEQTVRRFAVDEKRCCAFFGFDVRPTTDGLALRWDAPPNASELVDKLEEFFTTDKPLAELEGLIEGL